MLTYTTVLLILLQCMFLKLMIKYFSVFCHIIKNIVVARIPWNIIDIILGPYHPPLLYIAICCHEGQQRIVKPAGTSAVTMNSSYHQRWGGRKESRTTKGTDLCPAMHDLEWKEVVKALLQRTHSHFHVLSHLAWIGTSGRTGWTEWALCGPNLLFWLRIWKAVYVRAWGNQTVAVIISFLGFHTFYGKYSLGFSNIMDVKLQF